MHAGAIPSTCILIDLLDADIHGFLDPLVLRRTIVLYSCVENNNVCFGDVFDPISPCTDVYVIGPVEDHVFMSLIQLYSRSSGCNGRLICIFCKCCA